MLKRSWSSFILTVGILSLTGVLLSGCGLKKSMTGHHGVDARAELVDPDGNNIGMVKFHDARQKGKVGVKAKVQGLPSGFHGFHVHQTGSCEPDFTAAGGHLNPEGKNHSKHPGDMPVLLVNKDGVGKLHFWTDRFSVDQLTAGDGTAIIVHEKPDNYTNIPDRYTSNGPDDTTLAVGDAGGRLACGVVKSNS